MRAEVVSVGTEILLGQIVDTNAAELGRFFARLGISHRHRQTVGDNLERLTDALRLALSRADIVFTIGGLGPTEDDMTRDGIAAVLGETLELDQQIEDNLRFLVKERNREWVNSLSRQAMRPPSARPIPNENGTAPGLFAEKDGKIIVAMPGPRVEFGPMLEGPVSELLRRHATDQVIFSRTLRVVGIGESLIEEKVRDLLASEHPTVAPYAKTGEVHLRLTEAAKTEDEARGVIEPIEKEIQKRLGDHVYGFDETSLEEAVVTLLQCQGKRLAVAESCTGGGLGARITAIPGTSEVFEGGFTTYSNRQKAAMLGVSESDLDQHGAVSETVAEQMASGARERTGADYALSITGIAGPDGGTELKPVGTVWIGLAGPDGVYAEHHRFLGVRRAVRSRSTQAALDHLRRELLKHE